MNRSATADHPLPASGSALPRSTSQHGPPESTSVAARSSSAAYSGDPRSRHHPDCSRRILATTARSLTGAGSPLWPASADRVPRPPHHEQEDHEHGGRQVHPAELEPLSE